MIEAMSAGTPVVAWRNGSVPEVIADGVSGEIVDSIDQAASAVDRVCALDRRGVREYFESRFTAAHMAEGYVAAYEDLIDTSRPALRLVAAE